MTYRTIELTVVSLAIVVGLAALLVITRPIEPAPSAIGAIGPSSSPSHGSSVPAPELAASPTVAYPTAQPSLDAPKTAPPVGCGVHETQDSLYGPATTIVGLTALSEAVIAGEVISSGEGKWATPDGLPPAAPYGPPETEAAVYRIVQIQITALGKTRAAGANLEPGQSINVRVLGGTIGCQTYKSSSDLPFDVGGEVVMFLGMQPILSDAPRADYDAVDVWPIQNGVVEGRSGRVTPDELLAQSRSSP